MNEYIMEIIPDTRPRQCHMIAELVRCRNCRWWKKLSFMEDSGVCDYDGKIHSVDYFCASGEKDDGR